ncbi:hypothetical protein CP532_3026 [Ophiocordyceps camponoti-leonardi (nom. inval.)]|nr:hypothetical protein CP532_3026 [Ophiocordyceps camponoti-leonardi (nom. inval.)]
MFFKKLLIREIDLFICFSWRDWINAVISTWLFSLGALKDVPSTNDRVVNNLGVILWVTCCMYSFNLFTQGLSLEEDLINKPDRPIPSGKISAEEALVRSATIWLALVATVVTHPQIIGETVTWFLLTLFLGATKPGGHWFGKNTIGMSFGAWAFFSAARKLMAPARAESTWQAIILSIWAGLTAHIQDFRDQRGDRKVGRRTLPLNIFFEISPKLNMVRSVILLLGLPMLGYCASIPFANGTEASSHVKRAGECRTYQDCPICGFYERCCLPVLGGGFCQCGTSGRENECR